MMTEIANETARGQLEETQHKTKLQTHTMCQGKKPQQTEEKPADKLASTLPVTRNNAYNLK